MSSSICGSAFFTVPIYCLQIAVFYSKAEPLGEEYHYMLIRCFRGCVKITGFHFLEPAAAERKMRGSPFVGYQRKKWRQFPKNDTLKCNVSSPRLAFLTLGLVKYCALPSYSGQKNANFNLIHANLASRWHHRFDRKRPFRQRLTATPVGRQCFTPANERHGGKQRKGEHAMLYDGAI